MNQKLISILCLLLMNLASLPGVSYQGTLTDAQNHHPIPLKYVVFNCADQTEIPLASCEALVALYNSTNGATWINHSGWLETLTPCSWYGVTCHSGDVFRLTMQENNLNGPLPPELGALATMNSMDLAYNLISGEIPVELGALVNLRGLYLSSNRLTGSIPPEMGSMAALQQLWLESNQLSGPIPTQLGQLVQLTNLQLSDNQLSGSIPTGLGNLTLLQSINLSTNQLTGSIPASLGNLSNLTSLFLGANHLSGSIPAALSNLSNLQVLSLYNNQLSGTIPAGLGSLNNLYVLILSINKLSGAIPSELGSLVNLNYLSVAGNQFTGQVPTELGYLPNLQSIFLENNQLTGPIPLSFINLTNMMSFSFYGTFLCEPLEPAYQAWKLTVPIYEGNGYQCIPRTISGTVNDGPVGLAGVSVSAGAGHETITAADGTYALGGFLPGLYTVTPSLAGYTFIPSSRQVTITNADLSGVNFSVENPVLTYSLSGTITEGATGLAGVTVSAGSGHETVTAADGTYTLSGIPPGEYTILPSLAGYTFTPSYFPVVIIDADLPGVDFVGTRLVYSLSGTVTDGTDPMAGVTVSAGAGHETTTTADGSYTIPDLLPGEYTITPTLAGYSFTPPSQQVTITDADLPGVDFTGALLTYNISGTVTDGTNPISGVTISAGAGHETTTAADGSYTIPDLLPGEYTVTPSLAGYNFTPSSQQVTITNADLTGVDFTGALLTYSLSGTVTDGTDPIAGVTVSAGAGYETTTAADGSYTIPVLLPGEYTVTPTLAGYSFSPASQQVTITDADLPGVDFTGALLTYSLSGTVTDGTDPLAGVTVSAGVGHETLTTADGSYTIPDLLPGEYTVTPTMAGYSFSPTSQQVTITDANLTGVDFTGTPDQPATFSINGRVTDASGSGIPGVLVSTETGQPNSLSSVSAVTDADGYYTLPGLSTGTYTLTFTKAGYTFTPLEVTVTNQDITEDPVTPLNRLFFLPVLWVN